MVLLLSLTMSIGLVEPRSSIGHAVFHIGYSLTSTRPVFLKFYQWSLWKFEGGYLPPAIDEYLIYRLSDCKGTPEETAILDFQIHQSSARWGFAAARSHEMYKAQMIANILSRIDSMSDSDATSALLFIESLRRDDPLGKGEFYYMWDYEKGTRTVNQELFQIAKASFKNWWNDGKNWPSIKENDPLADTGIRIYTLP